MLSNPTKMLTKVSPNLWFLDQMQQKAYIWAYYNNPF